MLALRGRNAAILPSLSASRTSDGLDTRSARAYRANARAGPINPSADLAGRATRLGLEVIAKKPKQDFDQPGCQDGLRLTLTSLRLSGSLLGHAQRVSFRLRRRDGLRVDQFRREPRRFCWTLGGWVHEAENRQYL